MRHRTLLATTALLLGALAVGPTAVAAAPSERPPRIQGKVTDPRGDATGGPAWRHPRADLTEVRYRMPRARTGRMLEVEAQVRRFGFAGEYPPGVPFGGAPTQEIRTVLDGPGKRDWALTVYNDERAPRLVYLGAPSGEPRRIGYEFALTGMGGEAQGPGSIFIALSTEWLRGPDRLDLTTTGTSGEASDRTRTAERLNSRYAGPIGRRTMARGADGCTTSDDGSVRCTWTNGGLG